MLLLLVLLDFGGLSSHGLLLLAHLLVMLLQVLVMHAHVRGRDLARRLLLWLHAAWRLGRRAVGHVVERQPWPCRSRRAHRRPRALLLLLLLLA